MNRFTASLFWVIPPSLIAGLLALLVAVPSLAQSTGGVEDKLTDILSKGQVSHPELLTESDRITLIQLIKKRKLDQDADFNTFHTLQGALLALDDQDTIISVVSAHHRFDRTSDLNLSNFGTERVIDSIYEDLYLPASVQHPLGSDVFFPPLREVSADIIMSIVARSKVFPAATSTWARNHGAETDHDEFRFHGDRWRITVEWWERNKEAILAHNYQNATWLPSDLANPNTTTAEIVEDVVLTGHLHTLKYLQGNQKELAIELLKKSKPLKDNDFNQITWALLALGDTETIDTTVTQYHHFDSRAREALGYGDETVIERLGNDLSLPVSANNPNDKDSQPMRRSSTEIILSILDRSTLFGKPTSNWAKSMREPYVDCWEPVFKWWENNMEVIMAHRYSEATWLPPEPEASSHLTPTP